MNAATPPDETGRVGLRTLKSAARFLGLSVSSIYRLCQSGELELVKIGPRGTRVTQTSLDQYIKTAKRVTPTRIRP
jgi:excisionase family DNA binding protein